MSVSVEKLEKSMVRLTIEVSAEDFDKAINKVYNRQKNRMNVPGFRKGKTPRKVLEKAAPASGCPGQVGAVQDLQPA